MNSIVTILVAIYRANPLRPHCVQPDQHVRLCRWLGLDGPRCGDFDG